NRSGESLGRTAILVPWFSPPTDGAPDSRPATRSGEGGAAAVGGSCPPHPSGAVRRRFRVKHALKSIEDALILLDEERPNGVQIGALEQIRDDLAIVLRVAEAEARP